MKREIHTDGQDTHPNPVFKEAIVYDIETDNLFRKASVIHCVAAKIHNRPEMAVYVFPDRIPETKDWLEKNVRNFNIYVKPLELGNPHCMRFLHGNRLVCHNQLGFDLHVLAKFFGYEIDRTLRPYVDTLVMSQYLDPDRGKHGLEAWGRRVRVPKIEVNDWKHSPFLLYIARVVRDVQINELVYNRLRQAFTEPRIREGFRLAQHTHFDMACQEFTGVLFDSKYAAQLLSTIQDEMAAIAVEVEPKFGQAALPKSQQPTFPKKPFKKDGSLSASAFRYGQKIGITKAGPLCAEITRAQAEGPRLLTAPITLHNMAQVKAYLYTNLGWRPTMWRYNDITKDGKRKETDERRQRRAKKYIKDIWNDSPYQRDIWKILAVPEELQKPYEDLDEIDHHKVYYIVIRKGAALPMSPMMFAPVSKAVCPNLAKLQGETAIQIRRWMSLRNRRGVIEGWLGNDRLDEDGRLGAGSSSICNTHRQRHNTVVNVPKADPKVVYGKEMRSLFIAPEGLVCVGCDASGLENRVAGHYTTPYDGGEYARILLEGDTHSVNAAAYSEAIGREVSRGESKPITYGTLYGASGKKIAVMLDVPLALGQRVVDAFWNANPGLKAYKAALEAEWAANSRQFLWGIDSRYIRARSKHSLINSVFQSAGAIMVDRAWYIAKHQLVDRFGPWGNRWSRWGYFHDELQLYAESDIAEEVGEILRQGIIKAGEYYQLHVPLDGEFSIGKTWAETH